MSDYPGIPKAPPKGDLSIRIASSEKHRRKKVISLPKLKFMETDHDEIESVPDR
jgi:hypothetical protein